VVSQVCRAPVPVFNDVRKMRWHALTFAGAKTSLKAIRSTFGEAPAMEKW